MADDRLPPLSLTTVIVIVTQVALIGGTWAVMGERIQGLLRRQERMDAQLGAVVERLVAVERENATAEIRMENMRETLIDLRRQEVD